MTRASGKQKGKAAPDQELRKQRARAVLRRLRKLFPAAHCALEFGDPWELLVATVLSAQCTDVRVNKVTPELFRAYPSIRHFADSPPGELEDLIRSTGFFNNKAKNLRGAARQLLDRHAGKVPDTMADLLALPGVARKTANCVLGTAFGKNVGVVVDTHVGRLARRLGLTEQADPVKVERDLMPLFPRTAWTYLSHALILHGRATCTARKPACDACYLATHCPRAGVDGAPE
ncbi:MAG TPA: endonuclease III [Planctomycetota bacterium]